MKYCMFSEFKQVGWKLLPVCSSVALMVVSSSMSLAQSNPPQALGEINFETGCSAPADTVFEEGLILLHHMMYQQAQQVFSDAAQDNPDCAMLHWGIAMSLFHPMWPGQPSQENIERGQNAVNAMQAADLSDPRIQAYHSTVEAFYGEPDAGYRDRLSTWASAIQSLHDSWPEDIDGAAFYALAQLATAPRGDKTMTTQKQAGALLEQLHETAPQHPGVYHYAIHAYDNPLLSELGMRFAQGYGEISPDVPHALHMPSHIFVRLGMWDDVIDWNIRSAKAALAQPVGDTVSSHYAHAMDYRIYAHIQRGEFELAEDLVEEFLAQPKLQNNFGSIYAIAAAPARVLLEQDRWEEAAALPLQPHPSLKLDEVRQGLAIVLFAKAIGAARSDNTLVLNTSQAGLADIQDGLAQDGIGYWAQIARAQFLAADAWKFYNAGDTDLAITTLTEAADLEDAVGKSPVTPGHVLPIRELLGDMFAELGQKDNAISAYESVLKLAPNRRRSQEAIRQLNAN